MIASCWHPPREYGSRGAPLVGLGAKPQKGDDLMDKGYLESQYKLYMSCFKTAINEDEQWAMRKNMARIEALAMQEFGFGYADSLKQLTE